MEHQQLSGSVLAAAILAVGLWQSVSRPRLCSYLPFSCLPADDDGTFSNKQETVEYGSVEEVPRSAADHHRDVQLDEIDRWARNGTFETKEPA